MSDMFTDDAEAVCGPGEHTLETTVTGDTGLGSERCCWGRGKSYSLRDRGPGFRSWLCRGSGTCCVAWGEPCDLSEPRVFITWDKVCFSAYPQRLSGIISNNSHWILTRYQAFPCIISINFLNSSMKEVLLFLFYRLRD